MYCRNFSLRRIFGPKRDEMVANWRKLHKEELIITIIYSRSVRFVGHVARMGEKRNT
jgi:hypothetical protein